MTDLVGITAAALSGLAVGVPTTILAGRSRRPRRSFGRRTVAIASIANGVLWALVASSVGTPLELASYWVFATVAVALTLVDIADHRLPNALVIPALGIVTALLTWASWPHVLPPIVGGAVMFALYLAIALVSPDGMGMGDVKLAALVGVAAGHLGVTAWVLALASAFLLGGVVSIAGLAARRLGARSRIPFGPFMLAGAFLALLAS